MFVIGLPAPFVFAQHINSNADAPAISAESRSLSEKVYCTAFKFVSASQNRVPAFSMDLDRLQQYTDSQSLLWVAMVFAVFDNLPKEDPHRILCGNTICYAYRMIHSNDEQTAAMESVFEYLFGEPLFSRKIPLKSRTSRSLSYLPEYNVHALRAAFHEFYLSPERPICDALAGQLYSAYFQDWFRKQVRIALSIINAEEGIWLKNAAELYKKEAMQNPEFDGHEYQWEVYGVDLPEFDGQRNARLRGTLIRRQSDGTLPFLLECVRKILRDYDSEFLAEIETEFPQTSESIR